MSRFLKNATFPILIVVVLAFFAQRFLGQDNAKPKPNFGQFLTQVENGQVKSVTINTRDNTLNVTQIDGKTKKHDKSKPFKQTLVLTGLTAGSTHTLSARALLKTHPGQPAIHRTVRVKFTICG